MSCSRKLAAGQYWHFWGETDMGQGSPALCTRCGGSFKLDEEKTTPCRWRVRLVSQFQGMTATFEIARMPGRTTEKQASNAALAMMAVPAQWVIDHTEVVE